MTLEWFRSYHGAPSDTKLSLVAVHSKQPRASVTAIWWEVLDHASRNVTRGHAPSQTHIEEIAFQQNMGADQVAIIIDSMVAKGMIKDGFVVNWGKYQRHREDPQAAERQRKSREGKKATPRSQQEDVTQCHAVSHNVTTDTDTDKERKNTQKGGLSGVRFPEVFERFWRSWPAKRRCEKPNAYKAWLAATKISTAEEIMAGVERYLPSKEVKDGFEPYPAKWLKGERWKEDFEMAKPKGYSI